MGLLSYLLEDGRVVVQGRIDVVEVLKPERSLEVELVEQERCEIYI